MEAVAAVRRDIEHVRVLTAREVGSGEASIFDAHLSLLTDAEMLADVKTRTSAGVGAVSAWAGCLDDVERAWANLPDPYLRERAADVHAVAEQVVRALTGEPGRRMTAPGVLVADDLTPTEAAGLDLDLVTGVLLAQERAVSRDGVAVAVAANLGSVADARAALAAGADGAGLVRTEFLFLGRSEAPGVEEQEQEYVAIGEALGGRRVTLRSLDVGGDKPLPYLPVVREDNPFLGLRGLRLALARPALLHDQLVAVCRAARRTPTSLMFPMVSTAAELRAARATLDAAAGPSGVPGDLRVGMMVEVPAAALKIESFLPLLDFVSIGTNDLTQYALAAERGNPAVAGLADALDPAVLQLIDRVCQASRGRVDVAVCGEVAADTAAVALLVGLGVRELSVGPHAVPRVKERVRALDLEQCQVVAKQALSLESADEVREFAHAALGC